MAGERNEIRSTRRRQQDQRGGLIKFQRASSRRRFFFTTPLPLESFRSAFSTLISAGRRTVQRVSTFDTTNFSHATIEPACMCVCARVSKERQRSKRRETGTVDEHESAKIAKMTSASGTACWGAASLGFVGLIFLAATSCIRQSSRRSRQPRASRDNNYFRSSLQKS